MAASAGKTALFAWELGEGLGHLPTLKAIAAALQREGWQVAFALRDAVLTRPSLATLNCPVLAAPFWPNPVAVAQPSFTYADILAANGFSSARNLSMLLSAWDAVFDGLKPDLVVCEHAPGAAAAAFGRIPVAVVGNGFVVPPANGAVFATYKRDAAASGVPAAVLTAMQEAFSLLHRTPPETVTEPFRGAFRGVYSFPELDPYRAQRSDPVLGPLEALPALSALPAKRNVFAYSASDYVLVEELAAALMELGPQASAYFRGAPGVRNTVLKSRGVTIYNEAPDLSEVLPAATCVISHAGSGLASAALAAGRPQILSPRHGEADLTAKLLEELGVGISVVPLERKRLREAIERVHAEGKFATAAQRAGEAAQAFVRTANGLARTVAALIELS